MRGYAVPRVTEESRDPAADEAEKGDGGDQGEREEDGTSTDRLFTPPDPPETPEDEPEAAPESSPPTPDSVDTVPGDRGRSIARGLLVGLIALGFVLIVRGPPSGPSSPAAVLTSAELPSSGAPAGSSSVTSTSLAGASPASSSLVAADAGPPAPRPPPVWRVASLEHDAAVEIVRGTLGKHSLAGALSHAGIAKPEVKRVTHAIDGIRRIERGVSKDTFVIARDRAKGNVVAFEYIASPTDIWQAKSEDGLTPKKLELFVEKKRAATALVVTADLRKAIAAAGLREEAIEEIDDALDGHGDAATIKPGVRLRVIGNEEWVEGAFARFHVEAIEYVPKTGANLRVYFYERDPAHEGSRKRTPHPGFYDTKGQQPFRGTFRSPLPMARVTSRFNPRRMHPVLHTVMPHNGVDFGASTGTPVFASASGSVHSVGDGGPCGNMVQIEHTNGLTTAYCHLSRFAPGLHSGQHVEARQLVGYVGQTGRATGPHLHFAVKRGGNFIDPMGLKMDGVRTLPPSDREVFAKQRADFDAALDGIALPTVDGVAIPDDKEEKDEPGGEE